jgi:hypothetical protein
LRKPTSALVCAVTIASFCALLALAGYDVATETASAQPPQATGTAAEYVGNQACAECHRKEISEHKGSRHDLTLRSADVRLLGTLAPPPGKVPGTPYTISRQGDRFSFGSSLVPGNAKVVQLAFGSGKTGMTYTAVQPDNREVEFRMSRIPSTNGWYLTPGQEPLADLEPGLVHDTKVTRACIGCHAINVPQNAADIKPNMFGVGCESCHGPGSAHIAAARIRGNLDLKIDRTSRWTALQINALCAKCHRSQQDVSLTGRDASSTQRFQPYGLELSPCFKKSGQKISCTTCHNSHTDVSTDQKSYERVCLTCHASPKASFTPDPRVDAYAIRGKRPCPVNPRDKCVGCHMPATQVFPGSRIPVKMADHMIWAYAKRKESDLAGRNANESKWDPPAPAL